jgi:hypothetical protein
LIKLNVAVVLDCFRVSTMPSVVCLDAACRTCYVPLTRICRACQVDHDGCDAVTRGELSQALTRLDVGLTIVQLDRYATVSTTQA